MCKFLSWTVLVLATSLASADNLDLNTARLLISAARSINALEQDYKMSTGRFGEKEAIFAFAKQHGMEGPTLLLPQNAAIDLVVTPDGKHYSFSIKSNSHCPAKVFSDDSGKIRSEKSATCS
jgi:hypothetical protein